MDRVRFGAAYYAEYQRRPDIEADFDLMANAGFSVIRVGESVWSTWEPEDGRFELDWLEPVLDVAHRHDIGVILGTPTYAVPMWLTRRYPDIAAETVSGHRVGWGARQEVNFAHAAYRFHAERVIREVVGRYREHPAIVGSQVDNEPLKSPGRHPGICNRASSREAAHRNARVSAETVCETLHDPLPRKRLRAMGAGAALARLPPGAARRPGRAPRPDSRVRTGAS